MADMSQDQASSRVRLRTFKGRVNVQPGRPLEIALDEALQAQEIERVETLSPCIGKTLRAYVDAAKQLLSEKYRDIAEIAPAYLRTPCDCLVLVCDDGIVLRWDRGASDPPKVRVAAIQGLPAEVSVLAPIFSERQVYCPLDVGSFILPEDGPKLQMKVVDEASGSVRNVVELQYGLVVDWGKIRLQDVPSVGRPVPLVSLLNEFEVQLLGELLDTDSEQRPGEQFVLRSRARLPVGWESFQIYPPFRPEDWRPEVAMSWAELDLLAAAAGHSLREQQWSQIDPRAETRRQYASLLEEFASLLNGPEAPLQAFLEQHPTLLSPTHTKMWRKLPFGKRVTDFVFREPGNDYLLVELEAPTRTLFRRDGQVHENLTHAIDQVSDWIRYIEDNRTTVEGELNLVGISNSPRSLVVIGRSADLTDSDKRKLRTIQERQPKLRILTYDQLLENARATVENVLGPIWRTTGSAEVYYISRPVAGSSG